MYETMSQVGADSVSSRADFTVSFAAVSAFFTAADFTFSFAAA